MHSNTFGNLLRITTFGESHGTALGAIIDGVPAGIELGPEDIAAHLTRRRPGQSKITTARDEKDAPQILSGVFEGKTLGTPICVVIWNKDQHSHNYDPDFFRAGHADRVTSRESLHARLNPTPGSTARHAGCGGAAESSRAASRTR
ncbi:MAG: chorismate synthase [Bradymonadaceae bacterium]